MRASQRLAGLSPVDLDSLHANEIVSLRNSRRGLIGNLTRTINQVFMYLNEGKIQKAATLQNTMMMTYMKFRAINTEYMSIETDPKRVQECIDTEQRESNRMAEVEKEIRIRMRP